MLRKIVSVGFLCLLAMHSQADVMIESFEDPSQQWRFSSFPGEDLQPNSYGYSSSYSADGVYSIRLYGNTWKVEDISDYGIQIYEDTVWQVSVYTPGIASIQAFGLTDGEFTMRYVLGCEGVPPSAEYWSTTYAGWKNSGYQFASYKLPVGRDWFDRYDSGEPVAISGLLFINDQDGSSGSVYFDRVMDITDSEPISPLVEAGDDFSAGVGQTCAFEAMVIDPDSVSHDLIWDFGDGITADGLTAMHAFTSAGRYKVLFCATDESGRWDCDSLVVDVGIPQPEQILSVLFGGDVMLARRFEDADGNGIPGDNDGSLILPGDQGAGAADIGAPTRRAFADYRMVNLETPLTNQGSPHPTKTYVFRSRPDAVAGITENGTALVNLANNHALDYSLQGLSQTLQVLANPLAYSPFARNYAVDVVGADLDQYRAERPATLSRNGMRLAVYGMNSVLGKPDNQQPFLDAGHDKDGTLLLDQYNVRRCQAMANDMGDIQVAMFHSGNEYMTDPSSYCLEQSRLAISLGADLVIAGHPHINQALELRDGGLIAYSMGNFIFDQKYSITKDSFMLESKLDRDGFQAASVLPIFIEEYVPKFVHGCVGQSILSGLMHLSSAYDTIILPVGDRGIIVPDPDLLDITGTPQSVLMDVSWQSGVSGYVSQIIELAPDQHLVSVDGILGGPPQVSLLAGRDLLKFGSFEDCDLDNQVDEGTGWELDDGWSEIISQFEPFDGIRCLRLRRADSHSGDAHVETRERIAIQHSGIYSVSGWVRLVDANNATLKIKWMLYPYDSASGWDYEDTLFGPVDGTTGWYYFQAFTEAPTYLDYAKLVLTVSPPSGGPEYSHVYFDNLRLVEWETTVSPQPPIHFPTACGLSFIALQTNSNSDPTLQFTTATIAAPDADEDGLFDFLEDVNRNGVRDYGESDPFGEDSDNDGLDDWEEWNFGADGHVTALHAIDSDGDLFTDQQEFEGGTSPNDPESFPPWPTPTFTPTPSPTATSTMTPTTTASPTVTPTPTDTPETTASPAWSPSPSPTPDPAAPIRLNLLISATHTHSGEPFWLMLATNNTGPAQNLDLYVLLEVFGTYFSFPSWLPMEEGLDHLAVFLPAHGQEILPVIDEFTMPPVTDAGPFFFYAAMFESGQLDVPYMESNLAMLEFWLAE
ncbi:CapA family protein [bacterium]|nr:CapA family protein [candidate division CSSED10-310 bacterium]